MKKLVVVPCFLFAGWVPAVAQDSSAKEVNIDVDLEGGAWYTAPWVWIVGAALFILLLVALLRSGRRD